MITGTYNVPATLASQPILQELYLECDTSAPVTINLFEIADVQRQWDLVIYVSDATNNAGLFPITVNCGAGNHFDQLGVNTLTLNVDGSAVELRIVSDTAWLASKGSSGSGGGGGITDVTYSELYNLIITRGLTKGAKYRLLDYYSVNFLNGYRTAEINPLPLNVNFIPRQVYISSESEKLILTAISEYQLSPIAISENYDGDIIEYQAYTNKIGLEMTVQNGQTLPNATVVSGFDLQFDGQVYFNMPAGYLALYGQQMNIYADFDDGINPPYNLEVFALAFTPFVTNDVVNSGSVSSNISTDDQIRINLPNLTITDFNNYQANSLSVLTQYPIADARGFITRRIDTNSGIDVPFDFRNYRYRRFGVDLTALNPYATVGFYGIGDNYDGQGTDGTFADFSVFPDNTYDVQWQGRSSINGNYALLDNTVFIGKTVRGLQLNNSRVFDNTFTEALQVTAENTIINANVSFNELNRVFIDVAFGNNLFADIIRGKIGDLRDSNFNSIFSTEMGFQCTANNFRDMSNCAIGNGFALNDMLDVTNNQIGNNFQNNNIPNFAFVDNVIGNSFQSNTMSGIFQYNRCGNNVLSNIMGTMTNNVFGNIIQNNNFGNGFSDNVVGNQFYLNTFTGGSNSQNNFGDNFNQNTMQTFFFRNRFTSNTYFNTFPSVFVQNNFLESCFSNTFSGFGVSGNTFCNRFENNDFAGVATDNFAAKNFAGNTIGDNFQNNEFAAAFNNCTTISGFKENIVKTNLNAIDFSASTLVYQAGNKTIFQRSDGTNRLSYVNAADTVIYNTITF
jgi:hypothetical protein